MTDKILYILMRNDLASMNAGKGMAQASHASNAFIHKYANFPASCSQEVALMKDVEAWQKSTTQGFGTVLVLAVPSREELSNAVAKAVNVGCVADIVIDPTYPYRTTNEIASLIPMSNDTATRLESGNEMTLFRQEVTCGYIFGTKEALKDIVGKFPLHP